MRKQNLAGAVFVAFFAAAPVAMAAGGGGHGGGGMSGSHMSPSGQTNNDAQFNADATRGLDRAQERMSEEGAAHQQATAQNKQRGKTHSASRKTGKAQNTGKAM